MSTFTEIPSVEAWEAHLASLPPTTLLIVSFHAPWASPCAQMATFLATLAAEYPVTSPPTTSWVSVNAEELSSISEDYNITAVPFLALIRSREILETVSGSGTAKVRAVIEAHAPLNATSSTTTTSASATAPACGDRSAVKPSSTSPAAPPSSLANGDNNAATSQVQKSDAPVDPTQAKEELFARLRDLVKAAPVMLFMKGTPGAPQCGFSRQIVGILRENSVKYGFFNILADDEVRQGLKEFAEWPTYPQLWIGGELVGGLDIVKEELANDADFFKHYAVKSDGVVVC